MSKRYVLPSLIDCSKITSMHRSWFLASSPLCTSIYRILLLPSNPVNRRYLFQLFGRFILICFICVRPSGFIFRLFHLFLGYYLQFSNFTFFDRIFQAYLDLDSPITLNVVLVSLCIRIIMSFKIRSHAN